MLNGLTTSIKLNRWHGQRSGQAMSEYPTMAVAAADPVCRRRDCAYREKYLNLKNRQSGDDDANSILNDRCSASGPTPDAIQQQQRNPADSLMIVIRMDTY